MAPAEGHARRGGKGRRRKMEKEAGGEDGGAPAPPRGAAEEEEEPLGSGPSKAEGLGDYCPGMLLQKLLLSPGPGLGDDSGSEASARARSRSRSRSRCDGGRRDRSASPQPKKMPWAHRKQLAPTPAGAEPPAFKVGPPPWLQPAAKAGSAPGILHTKAKAKAKASPSACPPVAKAKAAPQALVAAAALLPARPKLIGAIRPSQSPRLPGSVAVRLTAASLAASVAPRGSALAAVPAPSRVVLKAGPGLSEGRAAAERRAMQALARHSARLGPAGPGLEAAVRAVLARAQGAGGQAALDLVERWDFLERQDGLAAFQALRRRFAESYDRLGRGLEGDREVLGLFSPPPARTPAPADGKPSAEVRDERWAPPPAAGVLGTLLELPPEDVRFAHNDQSERFGHGWRSGPGGGCVLQLTAELLAGLTQPSDVPEFSACWHEGGWFCRTGNRRLAAFRLAQRLAPKRFERLRVRAVAADESFARGVGGKRPKLTTQQNGEHCRGRWLVMRETQEVVGCARPGLREYGLDLLALLPFAEDGWGEPADGREVAGGA